MCRLVVPSDRSHLLSENNRRGCNDRPCWSFGCLAFVQQHQHHHQQPSANQSSNSTESSDGDRKRSSWQAILFGQTIALALSCANVASSTLENVYQIKVPTCQTGLVYFLLSFHLIYLFWRHKAKQKDCFGRLLEEIPTYQQPSAFSQQLSTEDDGTSSIPNATIRTQSSHKLPFTSLPMYTPWNVYLLLAILDVEANYLAMLSFQHTSLSSSMLLTSLSVLSTVLLRRAIFRSTNYSGNRLFGIFLCLAGGGLWLREEFYHGGAFKSGRVAASDGTDSLEQMEQTGACLLCGDLLALSAACLYGLNDVMAEYFVKTNSDTAEYLGMLGFFGSAFSFFVQGPLLEKESVQKFIADVLGVNSGNNVDVDASANSSSLLMGSIFTLLCFVVMLCYFYMSAVSFLSLYDSTILNLSLQTCTLWAVILTMFRSYMGAENGSWPPAIFFVSLAMVIVGMFLYERY